MLRAFSIAYWAFIGLTCPLFFVGALAIWLVTLPFDRRRIVLHLYSCAWAVFYVYVNPLWKLRTTGREHLPWRGPAVIVANHASLVDILVVFDLFRPFKWVSKAENFKIPFIGWNMRLNGYVSLVRGDRESVARMLDECRRLLARGNPVLFFPEGTRTRDGRLQPFKDGAFELAVEHGVPLVCVAVHGTGRALPKHGLILREHVNAHVEVLPPLEPADYPSAAALRDAARARIAEALG
ncbi:MAG: 1-acyl-sn-glycerol-3-phosphate acyltransferase [Solirubrobacteraceae bacterium]|nr:1-acyl-sn-glycerol-3-phosphate acyltransferase [Solirubrobacteraceae bacterium]